MAMELKAFSIKMILFYIFRSIDMTMGFSSLRLNPKVAHLTSDKARVKDSTLILVGTQKYFPE